MSRLRYLTIKISDSQSGIKSYEFLKFIILILKTMIG